MASGVFVLFYPASRVGARLIPPPVESPEKEAEDYCAATIYAAGITQFVTQPGVVLGVDCHVAPEEQIRHRHRHERAMQNTTAKAGSNEAETRLRIPPMAAASINRASKRTSTFRTRPPAETLTCMSVMNSVEQQTACF